jgi:hypothetical protein
MMDATERVLVQDIARALVTDLAPEERATFDAYSEQFFRDPKRLRREMNASGDEVLGFGASEAMLVLTPFALEAARQLVNLGGDIMQESVKAEGKAVFQRWLRRLFGADRSDGAAGGPVAALNVSFRADQLKRVDAVVRDAAVQWGVGEAEAAALRDRIITRLALPAES